MSDNTDSEVETDSENESQSRNSAPKNNNRPKLSNYQSKIYAAPIKASHAQTITKIDTLFENVLPVLQNPVIK